jgi:alkylation response protein AidB-like acyl-CoA dehydrogenase
VVTADADMDVRYCAPVDFELDDDQLALRKAAADLLDGLASSAQVRRVVDAGGGYDEALWAAMVEQGWPAIAVPESDGGVGLGWVEVAVLLEQMGRYVAPAPYLQHVVALELLARGGSRHAAPAAAGACLATAAFTSVTDHRSGDAWRLTGTTEPAVFGPSADVAVVRGEDAVYAVELGGLTVAAEPCMDRTREVGWLHLDDLPAERLGGPSEVELLVDLGALAYAAELLGVAEASLELAVGYAKEREQFGRPIGTFQAVKHRCADMLVDVEGMRSVVYYAAWCIAADDPGRSLAASTAKTWCSDAARRVTASCLQVHGGIGFTWESDVHLYVKRAQLDEVSFGDAVFHRARLGRMLRTRVEAGDSVL